MPVRRTKRACNARNGQRAVHFPHRASRPASGLDNGLWIGNRQLLALWGQLTLCQHASETVGALDVVVGQQHVLPMLLAEAIGRLTPAARRCSLALDLDALKLRVPLHLDQVARVAGLDEEIWVVIAAAVR